MSIEIIPVTTDQERKAFTNLPWKIYKDDPLWVAPLLGDEKKQFTPGKHPFWDHAECQLFLALKDGEPVGRISAQVDQNHIEFHEEKTGFFGFFECIENQEVATQLLDTATAWVKERAMDQIQGPFSFNTNGISGLLIEPFDTSPRMLMPYNPPYYADFIEAAGYGKVKDLLALDVQCGEPLIAHTEKLVNTMERIGKRAEAKGYTIREVNMKDFKGELEKLFEIYNEAWEKNWGFVPMTRDEFFNEAEMLKQVVVPELAVIVEHGDEPVGFGLALPDFYQAIKPIKGKLFPFGFIKVLSGLKKIDTLRLITLGFKRTVRKRGVDALMYSRLMQNSFKLPRFKVVECSWILEDNDLMISIVERIGGKVVKKYRVYEKSLK
jgi:hypothetical protein